MFGNNKPERGSGKRKGTELMNQLGLNPVSGIPGMDGMMNCGGEDDDDDLEAELAALTGEEYKPPSRKARQKKTAPMPMADIEKLAAQGMEDFDEDVSDTEDPDLMAELQELEEDSDKDHPPPSATQQQSPTKTQPRNDSHFQSTMPSQVTPPPSQSHSAPSLSPRPLLSPNRAAPPIAATHKSSPTSSKVSSPSPVKMSGARGMVGLLEERISMYKQAMMQAKAAGESSKLRRMDRGIKTLARLLSQAKAGKPVDEEEIPPQVFVTGSATHPSPNSSTASTPSPVTPAGPTVPVEIPERSSKSMTNADSTKQMLALRRDQYRKVALMAKRGGDMPKAGNYAKIAKQFELMMAAMDEGKTVDLSQMPPVPPEFSGSENNSQQTSKQPQASAPIQRSAVQGAGSGTKEEEEELPQTSLEEAKKLFGAPEAPSSVMEALSQRMAKYKESEAASKAAGDNGKARRMGRIVKQFQEAIKCVKMGKPYDFEELPTPPGYGPIPVGSSAPRPAPTPAPKPAPSTPKPTPSPATSPQASAHTASTHRPAPTPAPRPVQPQQAKAAEVPAQRQSVRKTNSRVDQQLAFVKERMGEFREAARKAKKNNDVELALKYFKMSKGVEQMVEALECGLPVDLSQVPPSPLETDEPEFVVVSAEDCVPTGDRDDVYKTLQEDLVRQIRVCVTNAQHYQKLGDVPATAKFQKLEQNSRRDLESLKNAHRHGDPVPRFHYETRTFSMVVINTDLGEADLEVTIERGIQYNLPSGYSEKDMDTCVKYEMAYPSENPQSGGTGTVKDTINPEYKEVFKLEINRSSKSFFRFVERKALKFEIFIKRGFFKGDKLIGTVNVKLQPLENKCTIHDSYDLMDGRKAAGGKLEVKMRVRDPFKSKQVEEVKEKWLVIDQFIRTAGSRSQADTKAHPAQSVGTACMEVLRFEKQTLDKQVAQLKDSLSVTQTQALRQKSALIQEKVELQQKKLREGGIEAWKAYLTTVEKEAVEFSKEARQFAGIGDTKKAELYLTKKKYAEKEIAAIKSKISPRS